MRITPQLGRLVLVGLAVAIELSTAGAAERLTPLERRNASLAQRLTPTERWNAGEFAMLPPEGDPTGEGARLVLLVNASSVAREVILSWGDSPRAFAGLTVGIAMMSRDTCLVEWSVDGGKPRREAWMLETNANRLACPNATEWFANIHGHRKVDILCHTAAEGEWRGRYDVAEIERALAAVHRSETATTSSVGTSTNESMLVKELPEKISKADCDLPESAHGSGGTVLLAGLIDTTGTVADVKILRSIPRLDAAATECARQWRYRPALANGEKAASWIEIAVPFSWE